MKTIEGKTFAPRDVTIARFEAKDNVHGIGYKPLSAAVSAHAVIIYHSSPQTAQQEFNFGVHSTKVSSGFGVGVLEDDADDDDLFAQDDMRMYDRFLGESAPVHDRFALEAPKGRDALTLNPHQDALLPGFVKAKKMSLINVGHRVSRTSNTQAFPFSFV